MLSTDCGFGRQGFNRHLAFFKTVGIPLARNLVLKELGLPERYVPAADPSLQVDVPPGPGAADAPAVAVEVGE